MPYAQSAARLSAMRRAKSLKSSFSYAKVRTKKLPTIIRDSVFQNCVFQLSSILEDFILEITSSWIEKIHSNSGKNSLVPKSARILMLAKAQEEYYRRYIVSGDETELTKKISENIFQFDLVDEEKNFSGREMAYRLIKERKFPSAQNLDILFRRMGLPKILHRVSKRTKSDVGLALQGFMDVRNALAHENPPSITDVDVERYFRQLNVWLNALDREFYNHVVRCSGANCWI